MLSHRISVPGVLMNPLVPKKGVHYAQPLVAQNCSKHLPFLLMSQSPCLPITPFHVLSSVLTCALRSSSRKIDYAVVTFCKATPTSSKKSWYCVSAFGAYSCKMYSDRSCSLSLRRQTLSPSRIQSVTQWARRGLTKMPTPTRADMVTSTPK